jgi:hypothetical protein
MIYYYILFYSILFYSILFYSILFYSILFYSILFYSILFCSILLFCQALEGGEGAVVATAGIKSRTPGRVYKYSEFSAANP